MIDEFDCKNDDESEENEFNNSKNIDKFVHNNDILAIKDAGYLYINNKKYKINNGLSVEDKKELLLLFEQKLKKFNDFKIKMEAIPSSTTKYNLARILPKKDWNKIRQETKEKYINKCGICKTSDTRLNCHEIWIFDDINITQTLKECISLCNLCHCGIHPTMTSKLSEEGRININSVIENFTEINKCNKQSYYEYQKYINDLELYRTFIFSIEGKSWKIDYGKYNNLVTNTCGNINEILNKKIPKFLWNTNNNPTIIDLDDIDEDININEIPKDNINMNKLRSMKNKTKQQPSLFDY